MTQTDMVTPQPVTLKAVIENLLASGAKFQDVRRIMMQRYGVKLDYTGVDRVGGRAQVRRLRQIEAGRTHAVVLCEKCKAMMEPGRTVPLCATCLEDVWR